jgi:hypothetical protein
MPIADAFARQESPVISKFRGAATATENLKLTLAAAVHVRIHNEAH